MKEMVREMHGKILSSVFSETEKYTLDPLPKTFIDLTKSLAIMVDILLQQQIVLAT